MQSHPDTHAQDPLSMPLGGDPERNMNYKQIPHNHPQGKLGSCRAVGNLEDVAYDPLFGKLKRFTMKDGTKGGTEQQG